METTVYISSDHNITDHHDDPSLETNIIITAILAVFLLVGSTGSLLTAVVIATRKHLHTKANLFIFSLCVSDLVSALICSPLWTYRRTWGFQRWAWGDFACKFYWVSDYSTNYITSLHIVSFAALRYAVVKRPFRMLKVTKKFLLIYIVILWLVAIITAFPLGFLMGVDSARETATKGSCWPSCSIANKENCCIPQYTLYIWIINPLMFYAPEILIVVFSLLICYEIKQKQRWRKRYMKSIQKQNFCHTSPSSKARTTMASQVIKNHHTPKSSTCTTVSEDVSQNLPTPIQYPKKTIVLNNNSLSRPPTATINDKRAFYQLSLIVISYAIGYIPATIYLQWSVSTPKEDKGPSVDYWFGVASYMFLRLSECMNPLMYNLGSTNIKTETKKLMRSVFCRKSMN